MTAGQTGPDHVGDELAADPRILLFMEAGRNRELLAETLGEEYRVLPTTEVERLDDQFDCCVFDWHQFNRVGGTIQTRRESDNPRFLPFVLLIEEAIDDKSSSALWEYIDDVVTLPVDETQLMARIRNLVARRQTSVKLAEREQQLESTIDDLKMKEQAMDQAPIGITIAQTSEDGDHPLIYANQGFQDLTGYKEEIIGRDCRFLQGEETDPAARAMIRDAIEAEEPISVDIVNYRANGQKFWNKLDIAPIDGDDADPDFVGFQTDITERKIRERRLQVLNRVLSHNLRNKMNIIEGYIELLRDEFGDEPRSASLDIVQRTASELLGLGESVREVQRTLSESESMDDRVQLVEQMQQLIGALDDRFPGANIELSVPDGDDLAVAVPGLIEAVEEAVVNGLKHNDADQPTVEIRIKQRSDQWLEIEIEDNGPGIPERELSVLQAGETDLRHADRLGLWMIFWIVNRVGGTLSGRKAEPRGTVLKLQVPIDP